MDLQAVCLGLGLVGYVMLGCGFGGCKRDGNGDYVDFWIRLLVCALDVLGN